MEVDIAYSLNFLRKINNLTINGKSIDTHFVENEYSLWSFQQFFLLAQIKEFSKYKNYEKYVSVSGKAVPLLKKIKALLMDILMLTVSFCAILKMYFCRPKVLLFCSDILKANTRFNPRIYNLFLVLERERIPYIEIIHTVGGMKLLTNLLSLRRLVIYSESFNILSLLFKKNRERIDDYKIIQGINLDAFNELERPFVLSLLKSAFDNVHISKFKIKLLRRVFKLNNFHSFVTIDDVRHTNEIIVACKEEGILSCLYQHSNFDYLIGLDELPPEEYIFPDIFYVWNTYWLHRIPELSSLYRYYKDRLKVGGRAYEFSLCPCEEKVKNKKTEGTVSVLLPFEVNLNQAQVRPYVRAMLQDARIRVFFSIRNDFDRTMQLEKYFTEDTIHNPNLTIFESTEKAKIIEHIDVVAGVYSGFLDESIEMCKPVALLKTDYPTLNRLDEIGMATVVDVEKGDLYAQLLAIAETPHIVLMERRSKFVSGAGDAQVSLLEVISK